MGAVSLEQILVTPLKRILVPGGDVLHAMKCTDDGFCDFGEAYFSMIEFGAIKAWKMHRRMTLNLVVPVGLVRFIFYATEDKALREEIIGVSNYARLTVPHGIWFGFQGLAAPCSLILNLANIPHDPGEVFSEPVEYIQYDWGLSP